MSTPAAEHESDADLHLLSHYGDLVSYLITPLHSHTLLACSGKGGFVSPGRAAQSASGRIHEPTALQEAQHRTGAFPYPLSRPGHRAEGTAAEGCSSQ